MFSGGGVLERSSSGGQQLFAGVQPQRLERAAWAQTRLSQGARPADIGVKQCAPAPGAIGPDRGDVSGRAGDVAGVEIDGKVTLVQPAFAARLVMDRGEDLDAAAGELLARRSDAVGGVAEYPRRAALLGLAVDQRADARGVMLAGRRDINRADQRLGRVGGRRGELEPSKRWLWLLRP